MTLRAFVRWFFITGIILIFLVAGIFISVPSLVRRSQVQQRFNRIVQEELGLAPSFKRFSVSILPVPKVHFEDFTLEDPQKASQVPLIHADRLTVCPSIFRLLFGHVELSQVSVRGANLYYPWASDGGQRLRTIAVRNINLDLWNVRSDAPVRFQAKGALFGETPNVELSGTLEVDFKNVKKENIAGEVRVSSGPIPISEWVSWWGGLPIQTDAGRALFSGQVVKKKGTPQFAVNGKIDLEDFVYHLADVSKPSTPATYQSSFSLVSDLSNGDLVLKEGSMTVPFGDPLTVELHFNTASNSLEEFLIHSDRLRLEDMFHYILPFQEILPINLGFSGDAQLDLYAKGKPEQLSLDVRLNLEKATLAYSKYFSKPTGAPFQINGNLKLFGGTVIRGDFGVEFGSTSLKGSIVGIDLSTGEMNVTVLTNKFTVDEWTQYIPPLKEFQLSGQSKILASVLGNLNRIQEAELTVNVSLDHLSAQAANGVHLHEITGNLDLGSLDSELKDVRFHMGNTEFALEGKMFREPNPRWLVRVTSEQIDVRDFVDQLRKTSEAITVEQLRVNWASVQNAVNGMIQEGEVFSHLDAQMAFEPERVLVPRFEFDAFGGHVSIQSILNFSSRNQPNVLANFNINRLRLADLEAENPVLEGNLFLNMSLKNAGPFDEEWLKRAEGDGAFSITNGEFHTMNILGSLSTIAELAMLGTFESGTTRFSDLGGDVHLVNGKAGMENLFMVADDFHASGAGEIDLDGNINSRLSVYLSSSLSNAVASEIGKNQHLGPIPILVVGTLAQPSVRTDPMRIQTFLDDLVRGRFFNVTSRFVPSFGNAASLIPGSKTKSKTKAGASVKPFSELDKAFQESGFGVLEQFLKREDASSS